LQHSSIERPPRSREILIIVIATAIALLLGYWYAIEHEHDDVKQPIYLTFAVASVGLVLMVVVGTIFLVLAVARHYQVNALRPLVADRAKPLRRKSGCRKCAREPR
jgi:hypothetical protein